MGAVEITVVALTSFIAAASVGGGLYETGVVDRVWPVRPDIVSPRHGGINRKWFWIPSHVAFELMLVLSLIFTWSVPGVRVWLLLALASHAVMRVWSFLDFVPKAQRFESMEPSSIDKIEARKWVRWSRWRLALDFATSASTFAALIALARLH